ncbi:MAG: Hsp20/alpha crystallin family protein [Leptonema sp. (in: bacteria)]
MYLKSWDDIIMQDISDFYNMLRSHFKQRQNSPYISIYESKDGLLVESEIPGISYDDINLELKNNILTLSIERKKPVVDEYKVLKNEIEYGNFVRSIQLPFKINEKEINAEYKFGILKIFLPKAEEEKPKKIPIKTNS